jgi:hypothetical protein
MPQTSAFDPVTQDDIRDLLATRSAPAVSIYQPSHRAGPEAEQNILRYKNLLSDAEAKLAEHGVSNSDKDGILKPARALLASQCLRLRNSSASSSFRTKPRNSSW